MNKHNQEIEVDIKVDLTLCFSIIFVFSAAYFLFGLIPLWDCGGFSSSVSCKALSFVEAAKEYRTKTLSFMAISLVAYFVMIFIRRAKD